MKGSSSLFVDLKNNSFQIIDKKKFTKNEENEENQVKKSNVMLESDSNDLSLSSRNSEIDPQNSPTFSNDLTKLNMDSSPIIYFYYKKTQLVDEKNIYLNNFYEAPMIIEGKKYLTVEHYYRSSKFADKKFKELAEMIISSANADIAKKLARKFFACIKNYDEILKWEEKKNFCDEKRNT